MKNKKRIAAYRFYTCLLVFILLVPFVGTFFWPTNETAEKKELASIPQWTNQEGEINTAYLSDWGVWFEDHFAFREKLITMNSKLNTKLFQTSPIQKVIYGENGWLYYEPTMNQYLGKDLLSERNLFNTSQNLQMMSEYAQSLGAKFVYMVCPNKNVIHDENLPDRYVKGQQNDRDNLGPYLEKAGVTYLDPTSALLEQAKDQQLYFSTDTHWNGYGALIGYTQLMNSLGLESKPFDLAQAESSRKWTDISAMIFPKDTTIEPDHVWNNISWQYVTPTGSNMDYWIETENPYGKGTLLAYRDSFMADMVPMLSENFEKAYYSRELPYDMRQIAQLKPDYVVVERVERRINLVESEFVIMPLPVREIQATREEAGKATVSFKEYDNELFQVGGLIDPNLLETESKIYVSLSDEDGSNEQVRQLFCTVGEDNLGNGFNGFLEKSLRSSGKCKLQVIVQNQSENISVYNEIIDWNGE